MRVANETLNVAAELAAAPNRLRRNLFWLLRHAARVAEDVTSARTAELGMPRGAMYSILAALDEGGPLAQAEIGRRVRVDPSTMVALLNGLEDSGYITREPDPDNKRRNRVVLSLAGHQALIRCDQAIAGAEAEICRGLTDAQREELVTLLRAIIDNAAG